MKFLAISESAATEMISNRFLQSIDYDAGYALAQFLLNQVKVFDLARSLDLVESNEGYIIVTNSEASTHYLVIDVEESKVFDNTYRPADILLHLQKILRFAIKFWANQSPSANERFLITTTKAVVFPYPIRRQTSVRVSLELSPDAKRLSRRGDDRRFILAYRCGLDEGGGPNEEVRLTNFRRFLDALPSIAQRRDDSRKPVATITSLAITSLEADVVSPLDPLQGFQRWMQLLTTKQKAFVEAELKAPHRIEGPAGTGKTLSLILKCIYHLKSAQVENRDFHALFVTHSDATRRTIKQVFEVNDAVEFADQDRELFAQTVQITTLQQLCAGLLRTDISESEFIDRDAMESKQSQLLYVSEAITRAQTEDLPTHKAFISQSFSKFLAETDPWALAEMMQHEISVVIKGRAEEKLDHYRKLPRLRYGLPVETTSDRGFVWMIFKKYQDQLQTAAQFDTDDIVLTAVGQLNTPIWRRRRLREGFDATFIDETHLFNLNELSLFHHLPRSETQYPIAYSVDQSQAIGDRGWSDSTFDYAISPETEIGKRVTRTEVANVFRCSPEIIDLAFSVTASGATLFTNFANPLHLARSAFTAEEERRCAQPTMFISPDDGAMVQNAFTRADALVKEMNLARADIALVAFSDELFDLANVCATAEGRQVEILKERGDIESVQRAIHSSRFILSTPDYVGGLEFGAVIILGVDEGRLPPAYNSNSGDSRNFLSYASHNRLYVTITRARYRIEMFISRERGPSSLLGNALATNLILSRDFEM